MEVVHVHQLQASTLSSSSYGKEGFGVPYFTGEIKGEDDEHRVIHQILAFTRQKKRFLVITYNKIHRYYSMRLRGGRTGGPFASLAHKLGRFKIRTVVLVQDDPSSHTQ